MQIPEYHWSTKGKGIILSAFSWGYMFAPLGAFLANKFGAATGYGIGIAATGLLTILTPFLIDLNWRVYLAARFLEGVFEVLYHVSYNLSKYTDRIPLKCELIVSFSLCRGFQLAFL